MTRFGSWGRSSKRKKRPVEDLFSDAVDRHKAGKLGAAARLYDSVLRDQPEHAGALCMRGVVELQRGEAEAAVELIQRAIDVDATQPGFFLNLGNGLRATGELEGATAAYQRALELQPDLASVHNNLGNVLRDRGMLADAASSYRHALENESQFFPAAANLAHLLRRLENASDEDAVRACDEALAIAEEQGLRSPDVANVQNARANALISAGRRDEAIAAYDTAITIDPNFVEAHLNLGSARARSYELEEAVAAFRRVIALRPEDVATYKRLALILRRLGRDDEAAEVYHAWAERDPDDPIAVHMAKTRGAQEPPGRAADAYVRREFDEFAARFDDVLATLDYRGPTLVQEALGRGGLLGQHDLDVLDAGCGTGLCVGFLRPIAKRLVGVDLSGGMLERARVRGGYDELHEAELTAMLEESLDAFDLVVAADVLVYFGELDRLAHGLRASLRPGGALVLTAEDDPSAASGWTLGAGGRYAHTENYLRRVLEEAGFSRVELVKDRLRNELGSAVMGWVVTASVPGD